MPKGPGAVLGRMLTTALHTSSRVIGTRKCACIAAEKGVKSAKKSNDRGKLAAGRLNKVQKYVWTNDYKHSTGQESRGPDSTLWSME